MPPSDLQNKFQKIFAEVDTWELATRMMEVYDDARRYATGNTECRRVVRMQEVVKKVMEELCDEVERAEKESV